MGKKPKAVVENGRLHPPSTDKQTATTILVGSDAWFNWLAEHSRFIFSDENGRFSARREMRRGQYYWYGSRRRNRKLRKTYLGRPKDLTWDCLQKAGQKLAGGERPTSPPPSEFSINHAAEESAFISTKFQPPLQRETVLKRPHLLNQMVTPLILIHAPSGFGKSTLLTHWMASVGKPVAWISLETNDDEPTRFWHVVETAVQKLWPEWLPPGLRLPATPDARQIQDAITRFINAVVSAPHPSFALILDGYHFIKEGLNHEALSFLINHMPQTMQLLISSDTRPPFSLSQWRAAGILTELTTDDLRLSMEEGIAFLQAQPTTQSLAYAEMRELVRQTNGWTAGLHLATFSIKQQSKTLPLQNQLGETEYFSEYFVENVLEKQETAVQQFLLQTSILKQFTADLCAAVTGQENSAQLLEDLWQANLFVTKLGGEPLWYRYHPLFTDVLKRQLQRQHADLVPNLHRRAARWYQANNAPEEAVRHLLASQSWEEAAALIESVALRELHEKGEDSRLLRWVLQLPVEVVQKHRALLETFIHLTSITFSQSYQEQFLSNVEENILNLPEQERSADEVEVLANVQFLRLRIAEGKPPAFLGEEHSDNRNDIFGMTETFLRGLQFFIEQDYPQAEAIMGQMLEEAEAARNLFLILLVGGGFAFTQWIQGRLRTSKMVAHQILQDAYERAGRLPEVSSTSLFVLAMTAYEQNQLGEAQEWLEKAMEVDPNPTSSSVPVICHVLQARIQVVLGDVVSAHASLRAALSLDPDMRSMVAWTRQDLLLWQAWVHAHEGDLDKAEQLLTSIRFDREEKAVIPQPKDLYKMVLAEIQLRNKAFEQAERTLDSLMAAFPYGCRVGSIVYPLVMQATAQLSQQKVNLAQKTMTKALRMAAPEDMKRPFLDQGASILNLLTLITQTGRITLDTRQFAQQLVETICQDVGIKPSDVEGNLTNLSIAASISDRELEVLQLVSNGLSNQAIAVRMMITVSTVNTHLKHIYRKLGVHTRTEAVLRAQELNLPL